MDTDIRNQLAFSARGRKGQISIALLGALKNHLRETLSWAKYLAEKVLGR